MVLNLIYSARPPNLTLCSASGKLLSPLWLIGFFKKKKKEKEIQREETVLCIRFFRHTYACQWRMHI